MSMTADLILKQQERIRQLEADLAAARADGERWRKTMTDTIKSLRAQHAELARVRDARDALHDELIGTTAELAQAEAERDALRADAERFRWIVDGGPYDGPSGRFNKAWREWDGSDNFRAAIDAARAKETK